MITSSRKSQECGFQFGGHSSVTINGDSASIYVGRLDNFGEAGTPRFQVWALYGAPTGDEMNGVLLAEAEAQTLFGGYYLEYISLAANLSDSVRGLYTIGLTVTRAGENGSYDDVVVMADLVEFYHPQLIQPAVAKLSSDGFAASVAGVSNPRVSGTTSGSLVIELWALAEQGGFTGNDFHLGGIEFIEAQGGDVTNAIEFNGYPNYPTGKFFPSIVLREWTGNGYLVRDRITAENAIQFPPQGGAVADAFQASVAEVTAAAAEPTLAKAALKDGPKQEQKTQVAKKVEAPVVKTDAAKPAAKVEAKPVEAKKVESKAPAKAEAKKEEAKVAPKKVEPAKVEAKKEPVKAQPKKAVKKVAKKATSKVSKKKR